MRDPEKSLGLSNYTCEMVQRGCGSRDSRQFIQDLETLGVAKSASVSISHTSFSAAMPAAQIEAALEIYADLVRRPHLPGEQMEEGRLVCLQELRAIEDDLGQKVMQTVRRQQYASPYGRNVQGNHDSVQQTTIDQIQQHYQTCYRPNHAILGVAGKIEWDSLKEHVGTLFADWEASDLPAIDEGDREASYVHLSEQSEQTHIGLSYPSVPYSDPDYFQARGAVGVLSDGMSSRLFTEVRENRGLCYAVQASCFSLKDRGSVMTYAGTTSERAQETLDVTLEQLTLLGKGIEPDELELGKLHLVGDGVGAVSGLSENLDRIDGGVDENDLIRSISIEIENCSGLQFGFGAAAAVLVQHIEPVRSIELEDPDVAARGDHQLRAFRASEQGQGGGLELRQLPLAEAGLLAEVLEGRLVLPFRSLLPLMEKEGGILVGDEDHHVGGAVGIAVEEPQAAGGGALGGELQAGLLAELAAGLESEYPQPVFSALLSLHDPGPLAALFNQGGSGEQHGLRGQCPGLGDRQALAGPGAHPDGFFLGAGDDELLVAVSVDVHARQAVHLGERGVGGRIGKGAVAALEGNLQLGGLRVADHQVGSSVPVDVADDPLAL